MKSTVFFSVGEPSGDQHAARLIEHIQQTGCDVNMRGFGGQMMEAAGCEIDRDLTEHAVVGIVEVLPKLRQFFSFVDEAEEVFKTQQVDLVVLVDFPGFNWHIARRAKKYNIPVVYYCPPQLWAWGGWRVRKLRRNVDHVLSVLPIEERYFQKHNVPTTFVGHPFFDAVQDQVLDADRLATYQKSKSAGRRLIAVLPGSRTHEVKRNWPLMLESIRRLSKQHSDAIFLVAAYREHHLEWCRKQLQDQDKRLSIDFGLGVTSEIIQTADCAMMVSGSVSLELMARRTPAAVIYRVGRIMSGFGKCVIGVDSMTLPNLMGDQKVFPEMVSVGDPEPAIAFLTQSVSSFLGDPFYYQQVLKSLDDLSERYAQSGASGRAARWITEKLGYGQSCGAVA